MASRSNPKVKPGGPASKSSSSPSVKTPRPSDRLNPKTVDPFASSSKAKSAFAAVYSSGGIPCRLVHGSVKHKLAWNPSPEEVPFDPMLVTLAEGIRETVHPYSFVARIGFKELLETPDSGDFAVPLIPRLVMPLKAALTHKEGSVFEAGIAAVVELSNAVGPALNPHLKNLLVPISKRVMEKNYREKVTDVLHTLEQNGGQEALAAIKSKVPTYTSINF